MPTAIRIVVALLALLLLLVGLGLMLNPTSAQQQLGIQALGIAGLSTVRGDLGGMFVGSAALLAWGVVRGRTLLFLAVAVLLAAIASGRLIGFVMDGASARVIAPFAVELVMALILVFAHVRLATDRS